MRRRVVLGHDLEICGDLPAAPEGVAIERENGRVDRRQRADRVQRVGQQVPLLETVAVEPLRRLRLVRRRFRLARVDRPVAAVSFDYPQVCRQGLSPWFCHSVLR